MEPKTILAIAIPATVAATVGAAVGLKALGNYAFKVYCGETTKKTKK